MEKINLILSSPDLISSEKISLLLRYLDYCQRALEIKGDYDCIIVHDRKIYGIKTTAVSSPETKRVLIYGKRRSFADILRSIAHELVHIMLYEKHRAKYDELHFSSSEERKANEMAGELLSAFATVVGYDLIYERKQNLVRGSLK